MSEIWWALPLLAAAFGAFLALTGLAHIFGGRFFKGGRGLLIGAGIGAAGLAGSLFGLNVQTYSRLTYEKPVAEVSVRAVNLEEKRYAVTILRLDGSNKTQTCEIQGDEWILGGRVQKWQPWANVLGLNTTYSLDQLANKYFTAAEANNQDITACDIEDPEPVANQFAPAGLTAWLMGLAQVEDRKFGSASYMPLADGAVYRVLITQSAFNAEPVNDVAKAANDLPQ